MRNLTNKRLKKKTKKIKVLEKKFYNISIILLKDDSMLRSH